MTSLAEIRQQRGLLPSAYARPPDPANDEAPAGPAAGASEENTKDDTRDHTAAPIAETHGQLAVQPANIPAQLRALKRWAPWRAQWNEKRGKWDKLPCQANGFGLSTAKPERWVSFDAALAALQARPDCFAGLGYLMTGPHGLVGIDLDGCVTEGAIEPWAQEIVSAAASYAELSPSGKGLRIFTAGEIDADWTVPAAGLEVYAGHAPRFLTVTGARLPDSAPDVQAAPSGFLAGLQATYPPPAKAEVQVADMPELLDELSLPAIPDLGLPSQAVEFLAEGKHRGDRSRELFATAVALFGAGLDKQQVLSTLAASPYAMEVALDHRRQEPERALAYLWKEHVQKADGRSTSKVATLADFDDVSQAAPAPKSHKGRRFRPIPAVEVLQQPSPSWLIKRVLPERGVGMVFGPSMSGKSFFIFDMAAAVALGRPWRDHKVKQGAVAYVVAEGAGGYPNRLRAYLAHHGVSAADLPVFEIPEAPNLLEKGDVKELVADLRGVDGLRLVIVDTLAQATPGADENSSKDMGLALAHCKAIGEATGALVLLVGHTGKDESRGVRGHSSQIAAFDVAIQVEQVDDYRAATVRKLKDGQEGDEFAFHLQGIVVGQDDDGDPVTSCVALPGNKHGATRPDKRRKPKGQWQELVLEVATALTDMPGSVSKATLLDAAIQRAGELGGFDMDRSRDRVRDAFRKLADNGLLTDAGGHIAVL